jgi:hypothetical protein
VILSNASILENYCALWLRLVHILEGVRYDDLHNYAVAVYCSVIAIIVAIISPVLGML